MWTSSIFAFMELHYALALFLRIGYSAIHVEFGDSYAGQIRDWWSCTNRGNAGDQHTCFFVLPWQGLVGLMILFSPLTQSNLNLEV